MARVRRAETDCRQMAANARAAAAASAGPVPSPRQSRLGGRSRTLTHIVTHYLEIIVTPETVIQSSTMSNFIKLAENFQKHALLLEQNFVLKTM